MSVGRKKNPLVTDDFALVSPFYENGFDDVLDPLHSFGAERPASGVDTNNAAASVRLLNAAARSASNDTDPIGDQSAAPAVAQTPAASVFPAAAEIEGVRIPGVDPDISEDELRDFLESMGILETVLRGGTLRPEDFPRRDTDQPLDTGGPGFAPGDSNSNDPLDTGSNPTAGPGEVGDAETAELGESEFATGVSVSEENPWGLPGDASVILKDSPPDSDAQALGWFLV